MRILYYCLHDSNLLDLSSGMDYFSYQAICGKGFEVQALGPGEIQPLGMERLIQRVFTRTGKRFVKYHLSVAWRESQALQAAVRAWNPDVVLTTNMASLVFYHGNAPVIFIRDTTLRGQQQFWPVYGRMAERINYWQERCALNHSAFILTKSHWSRQVMVGMYRQDARKIAVFAIPSALPHGSVPERIDIRAMKRIEYPLRLLLVGRDSIPPRKGLAVGVETVRQLNAAGVPAKLTICGTPGQADEQVCYVGPYKKGVPEELEQYVNLYRQAHFLLHPAIFEAAGIVPAEAAAFGTPTITNDAGGLGTTVKNEESGVVLPKWSPPEAYVKAITDLIQDPERYYSLCARARARYERELNWQVTGDWLAKVVSAVAGLQETPNKGKWQIPVKLPDGPGIGGLKS